MLVLAAALVVVLHSRTPIAGAGTVTGRIEGCFGFTGPPETWTVHVAATQGAAVKATTVLHTTLVHENGPGSAEHLVGNVYRLVLPVGEYDLTAEGTNLRGPGPHVFRHVAVRAGITSTADWIFNC